MNIVKLQDDLKGVPDQSLIGYVQNPTGQVPSYLALSELQRRKKMRDQFQGEQTKGQQPSVAEQIVSSATPAPQAPQGIAGIPVTNVGNAEAYATGGIVAFERGGTTLYDERKVDPSTRYALELERAAKERGVWGAQLRDAITGVTGTPSSWRHAISGGHLGEPYSKSTPAAEEAYAKQLELQSDKINREKYANTLLGFGPMAGYEPSNIPQGIPELVNPQAQASVPQSMAVAPPQSMRVPVDQAIMPPTDTGSARQRIARSSAAGASAPNELQGIKQLQYTPMPSRAGEFEITPEVDPRVAAQRYKDIMGTDPFQAKAAEKLAAMESADAAYSKQMPWMSLAEAGLAMAAGKSPNALSNIAEGGIRGVTAYKAGQDKIRSAEEKLFNAQAKVAEAQRAEDIAAAKHGMDSEQVSKAARRADKARVLEYEATLDYRNKTGSMEAQKGNIANALERQKMADEKDYRTKSLQVQKAQAAKLSDYETFIKLSEEDPANYKEVKSNGKTKQIFDIAKVSSEYKSYGKTSSSGIDEDTIVRGFNKAVSDAQMTGEPIPSYTAYKAQFLGTIGGGAPTGPRKKPLADFG